MYLMKKLINQKVKFYGKTYTIRDYDETGSLCLYNKDEGEVWFNATDTYKDFGGNKDFFALKGESVEILRTIKLYQSPVLKKWHDEAYNLAF
jgi:hypothetical protein